MQLIKNILFLFLLMITFSCIKPFDPIIESNEADKYVVSGRVTDEEGWQVVSISLTSPIGAPEFIPVSGCQVQLLDDKGTSFDLEENEPGYYRVWLGNEYLIPGTSYKINLITPDGMTIESTFEKMNQVPPIDSVYFLLENIPTTDPAVFVNGIQFYVDLNAQEFSGRFYKWELEETWEYHAAHPVEYYYDGDWHRVDPPDFSNKVCYTTQPVKNIYTISTKNLLQNTYHQYALNFVDSQNSRLGILYSFLLKQISLSEEAYNYWEQLRTNSTEQGGLYEKQPLAIKGNLQNLTNPDKEVLGYFYAASVSSKRYFWKDIEGLEVNFYNYCFEEPLGLFGWREYGPRDYPIYYYYNLQGIVRILGVECVDCRALGGKTLKPDFWP